MKKSLLSLLLIAAMCEATAVGMSGTAQKAFSITIGTEKAAVKTGSQVWVKIQLTNTSNREVDCSAAYVDGVDARYQYDVRGVGGNPVRKIVKQHPELVSGSIQLCTLKRGESTDGGNDISTLFDMSQPGEYVIQLSRPVSSNPKDGVVKSNKIVVTVTP